MRKNEPTSAADIVAKLVKTTKIGQSLEQAQVWERWEEIVGPKMMPHCRPVWIRDNTLRIEADSSVNMHKLSYRQWDIIKRINRIAGKELVGDVFIVLMEDALDR